MKTLFIAMSLLCLQTAFAQDVTELVNGDLGISQADASIVSVRDICPPNPGGMTCMAYGSIVEVKVALNGCMDTFGGYFSKFEVIDGKGVLNLSAINITNEKSQFTRCLTRPFKMIQISVPFEGEIELVKTEFTGVERK